MREFCGKKGREKGNIKEKQKISMLALKKNIKALGKKGLKENINAGIPRENKKKKGKNRGKKNINVGKRK